MPRAIAKSRAIVMRSWRMGETSKLAALYTESHGKIRVTAKGARKPKSKFGAALELFSETHAVFYFRDDRDLHTLTECDLLRSFPQISASLERVSFASAACELVDRLTIEHEANRPLYGYLLGVLKGLQEAEARQLDSLFWYFQLRLADSLGYRPELEQCISCGGELAGERLSFSAARGGGLCGLCGTGQGSPVSGASMRFVRELQQLPAYNRQELPFTPEPAGEISHMLRGFLEYHAGERSRLRSLEFLDDIRRGR